MYSCGDRDCTTRVLIPSCRSARCSPLKASALNPRSLRPLVSVTRPTLNSPPPPGVDPPPPSSSPPLQPEARSASAVTSSRNVLFTVASEVLDCGTKTMSDCTTRRGHAVLAVLLQVRDGRLAALVAGGALPGGELAPDETLEECARRHVGGHALRHLEQLET